MSSPKAEIVKRFREATGMGWIQSKLFLAGRGAELCERILEARIQQINATVLHDPIEDHPEYSLTIRTVRDATAAAIKEENARKSAARKEAGDKTPTCDWPLGTCHLLWRRMKEQLAADGVTWYSPAEMNPGHHFD